MFGGYLSPEPRRIVDRGSWALGRAMQALGKKRRRIRGDMRFEEPFCQADKRLNEIIPRVAVRVCSSNGRK